MRLADDQIINNSYNALDELSKRINWIDLKDTRKAAQVIMGFESDVEKTKHKENPVEQRKTVIDPEDLLKGIQEDMSR